MATTKQNWFKRALSLLLALVMCMGMASVTAVADTSSTVIEDGVYHVKVNLLHAMTGQYSMGNASVRGSDTYGSDDYQPLLIVENGQGFLIMEFMPMSFAGMYGYLFEFDTLSDIEYNQYQYPVNYTTHPATVLAEHRMTDGTIALDAYNKETSTLDKVRGQVYPHIVMIPVELPQAAETLEAIDCPFVHVYVPVMGELSSGDQVARLQLDYSNMTEVTDLSGEVEYWLYKAMNTEQGKASDETWNILQDAIIETTSKLSNTLVSIDADGSNRTTEEMDKDARMAQVQKLKSAIEGVIVSASENGWDGKTITEPKRKGTEVYVSTAAELAWVAEQVNNETVDFLRVYLIADIDLNNKPWTPIGTYNNGLGSGFAVDFYGNGHTISNLYIDSQGKGQGLFGSIEGSSVAPAIIDGVKVAGSIVANDERTGGIAGYAANAIITNCENYVNITQAETYKSSGQANAGGIVGFMGNTVISNCFNYGTISYDSAYANVGGIVGWVYDNKAASSITNCGNEASISGGNNTGGISGHLWFIKAGTPELSELYNRGNISGCEYVGGVFGKVFFMSTVTADTYSGMYNTGAVASTTGNRVGGIAGSWQAKYPSVFQGMYAAGSINITGSKTNYAGIIGVFSSSGDSSLGNMTLDSLFFLRGLVSNNYTYLTSGSVSATEKDLYVFSESNFKSDIFFTYMDDLAYLFAEDTENVNGGYPVLAFESIKALNDIRKAAIKELETYKDSSAYKGAALNAFASTLAAQEAAIWNATDEAAVAEALQKGKDALDGVPTDPNYNLDLTDLNAALETAQKEVQKTELYTANTIEMLKNVIDSVQNLLENGFGSKTEVAEMTSALQDAVNGLEYRPADYSAVDRAVAEAQKRDPNDYVDFSEVEKALNAVITGKNITEQAEVDAMAQAIEDALAALVAKDPSVLDKDNLSDGIYSIWVDMVKLDRVNKSMADNAINHIAKLEVIDGRYYVTLDFKGITIESRFGYLENLSYYDEGYSYGQFGAVEGVLIGAEIFSTQKDSDGNDVVDQYNSADNLYPDLVRIEIVPTAIADKDGYVPLHVFVPIMEAIAAGSGDQDVLMQIDWTTLKKTTEDDPAFQPEDPVEQSPAVDYTDVKTGVKIHADKGVFEEGVQIIVTEIIKGADYDNAVSALNEIGKKFKLYDVKFLDTDGNEVASNGTVSISLPVTAGYDSANLAVYRMTDDGKILVKGAVENGYYTVITKTAGAYALVENGSVITDVQNTVNVNNGSNSGTTSSPQTGDDSNLGLWFMLMLASAGMVFVLIFIRKRKTIKGE